MSILHSRANAVSSEGMQQQLLSSYADVGKIQYRPDAPADEVLCFRHYNAQQVREMLHARIKREVICFYLLAGCEGSDDGGMAPVLCLLLAHIQRHW